jgi:hypothetical protein
MAATRKRRKSRATSATADATPRCGLCGNTQNLTKTECCGNWICDDEDTYVLFSYARNSCYRNHDRYTLCSHHHIEGHEGRWQECARCRESIETEMYVWYGTNEYNFEKLKDPPAYEPTRCAECNRVIVLAEESYVYGKGGYRCARCAAKELRMLRD